MEWDCTANARFASDCISATVSFKHKVYVISVSGREDMIRPFLHPMTVKLETLDAWYITSVAALIPAATATLNPFNVLGLHLLSFCTKFISIVCDTWMMMGMMVVVTVRCEVDLATSHAPGSGFTHSTTVVDGNVENAPGSGGTTSTVVVSIGMISTMVLVVVVVVFVKVVLVLVVVVLVVVSNTCTPTLHKLKAAIF